MKAPISCRIGLKIVHSIIKDLPGVQKSPCNMDATCEEHQPMTREQKVRAYGAHLALITRGTRGGPIRLAERYDRKRKLGTYRTVAALKRAIERHGSQMLRELQQDPEVKLPRRFL